MKKFCALVLGFLAISLFSFSFGPGQSDSSSLDREASGRSCDRAFIFSLGESEAWAGRLQCTACGHGIICCNSNGSCGGGGCQVVNGY
jgi:hypothetical protein